LSYELLNATQGLVASGSISTFPAVINLTSFTPLPNYILLNNTWEYPLIQIISNVAQAVGGSASNWLALIINGEFSGSAAAQLAGEVVFWLVMIAAMLTVRRRYLPVTFIIMLLVLFLLSAIGITPPGAFYVNMFLMFVFAALLAWFGASRKW